ncbi:uncharacterized protein LOC17899351 [Capsella rubella]|uniref:uncharacterized protein LOC17899351 n=1 Tax=Capsella rubella TaxID=81985 RepID=UPI000CD50B82|nr:uncharacterized protein LOC17899351 [Capsella rubella]
MLPCQILSAPSPQQKAMSSTVTFKGWRVPQWNYKSWVEKMSSSHEAVWRKAGIFDAVVASTRKIIRNADLVLGIAEKWCPETKTFVFPWGEATITLEDVMLLSGFSVLGTPFFATLDSSGERILKNLNDEWCEIRRRGNVSWVTQKTWMDRFMNAGDELEHVGFLSLWLSYFVFPSTFPNVYQAVFPIAVHLSMGTKLALGPPVLAHLYADLALLQKHIKDSSKEDTVVANIGVTALFKLLQVWTWERFKELQPQPNPLLKDDQPRLALWSDLKQETTDARQILENSEMDSFEWRPYTKTVGNWKFPQFYPEKAISVPVSPSLDDEFISFARCNKVSLLVGMDNVESYFPNRVASQFGMLQDIPSIVPPNNLSEEAAWNDYNKPISAMELYIPSRSTEPCFTPTFSEWWRKTFPELQYSSKEKGIVVYAGTSKTRNIIGDNHCTSIVPSGSMMNSTSDEDDEMSVAEYLNRKRKCMEQAHVGRGKRTNQARKKRRKYMFLSHQTGSENVADGSGCEAGDDIAMTPFVENNSSDPPLGANEEVRDNVMHGSNADLMDDGSMEPKRLFQEDGVMVGSCAEEKLCSNEAEKEDNVAGNNWFIGAGDDPYGKRIEKMKEQASSLEERMDKALKTVAWLKEKRAQKLRNIAAARLI